MGGGGGISDLCQGLFGYGRCLRGLVWVGERVWEGCGSVWGISDLCHGVDGQGR